MAEPTQGGHWVRRLSAIRNDCQRKGWDSYGARPVTMEAIKAARVLCDSIDVVPTVNGGISIILASEGITVELDALGHVVGMWVDVNDTTKQVEAVLAKETTDGA